MVPVALSDVIAVGEVPTAAEIEILAKAGFRSLLNTQPDGEVARFATAAETGTLATGAGLTYQHVPVLSRRPDATSLAAFTAALDALPRPIYACCYSGARTAAAWALAAAPHYEPDQIIASCKAAGFDVSFMREAIEARQRAVTTQTVMAATGIDAATFIARAAVDRPDPATAHVVPLLSPSGLMPRAATAGGFAVAG